MSRYPVETNCSAERLRPSSPNNIIFKETTSDSSLWHSLMCLPIFLNAMSLLKFYCFLLTHFACKARKKYELYYYYYYYRYHNSRRRHHHNHHHHRLYAVHLNYMPETSHVFGVYNIAATLWLQLMLLMNVLYSYMRTYRSTCAVHNMAVFCISLKSCFPGTLLRYFMNDIEMVPVARVMTSRK